MHALAQAPFDSDATYSVSVRHLCDFAAKSGDLDLRFKPTPTAKEGREGHQLVSHRRGPDCESEVTLCGSYKALRIRGRADGYDPSCNTLEEVKTFRGRVEAISHNHTQLHWAQLKVYGWLMCQERGLKQITLSLVYFDVAAQTEHPFNEDCSAEVLETHFNGLCQLFLTWALAEIAHRSRRDGALRELVFPQLPFRPGQHDLASRVYRAVLQSKTLLAQAPTGIGKTIGVLYPALRALPERGIDKVFYLTAKTPGRQIALDALQKIKGRRRDFPLRVVELVAKDKSCEYPQLVCHGESCPLARGFYDRLPAARKTASATPWLGQSSLREVALAHQVCPYYLSHEMVKWADVVVGDYNYYFDRSAMLYALTLEGHWRVSVLVDEAHNLYNRACSMFSETLGHAQALALRPQIPSALRRELNDLLKQWQLLSEQALAHPAEPSWQLRDELPELWLRALQTFNSAAGDYLHERPSQAHGELLHFYFQTVGFAELAAAFADHSLCEFDRDARDALDPRNARDALDPRDAQNAQHTNGLAPSRVSWSQAKPSAVPAQLALLEQSAEAASGALTLRNIVPAHFIAQRIEVADSMVLFSATLNPADYYTNLLGLPEDTWVTHIPSPFDPARLSVRISPISTRRDDRAGSLDALIDIMVGQYRQKQGNYLAFFGSFDYMEMAQRRLAQCHPEIPHWVQSRSMSESERDGYLQAFEVTGHGIGFAVLGGVFGEGVDLPGDRLIGAFIATLGLPQFDRVNQAICERMQSRFGKGYDYTYLYPGSQKVIQAAGRVIRDASDSGVVVLMDERYQDHRYRRLLPVWWQIMV